MHILCEYFAEQITKHSHERLMTRTKKSRDALAIMTQTWPEGKVSLYILLREFTSWKKEKSNLIITKIFEQMEKNDCPFS